VRLFGRFLERLSEKGLEQALEPPFWGFRAANQSSFYSLRHLPRLQLGGYPDFSDSFEEAFSETQLPAFGVLGSSLVL
jgi:hypothetical protein